MQASNIGGVIQSIIGDDLTGKELHGPDRMYLNPNSIVFVEPVGPESRVAQLISEANKQP